MKALLIVIVLVLLFPLGGVAQEEEEEFQIALYDVNEDGTLELAEGEEDDAHLFLWETVTLLLPSDYISSYVYEFAVFESEDTFAYVNEIEEDVWQFAMNVAADPETILTIVHEFAHIVALNNEQYETYAAVIAENMDETPSDEAFADDQAACPTIAFEDGCALETSYLLEFTQTFWTEEDVELVVREELEDSAAYFYDENPDAFVNEYAATDPIEDFAETFAYFVALDEVPDSTTVADQKILWFYDNPDMVAFRDEIRANADDSNFELVILDQ